MNLASTPALLREKIVLSQEKLDDINSLLKNRFGDNWKNQKNLQYFVKFYQKGSGKSTERKTKKIENVVKEIEEYCTCCAEDESTFLQ